MYWFAYIWTKRSHFDLISIDWILFPTHYAAPLARQWDHVQRGDCTDMAQCCKVYSIKVFLHGATYDRSGRCTYSVSDLFSSVGSATGPRFSCLQTVLQSACSWRQSKYWNAHTHAVSLLEMQLRFWILYILMSLGYVRVHVTVYSTSQMARVLEYHLAGVLGARAWQPYVSSCPWKATERIESKRSISWHCASGNIFQLLPG